MPEVSRAGHRPLDRLEDLSVRVPELDGDVTLQLVLEPHGLKKTQKHHAPDRMAHAIKLKGGAGGRRDGRREGGRQGREETA